MRRHEGLTDPQHCSRELRNENIDVINFTANEELLVQRALSPAKITSMALHP